MSFGHRIKFKEKNQANGSFAVPVLKYSPGITNCHLEELQNLDMKMRNLLTIHGPHHPKAAVDHL